MEDEIFYVSIKGRTTKTDTGDIEEVSAGLNITKEEFEDIVKLYSKDGATKRNYDSKKRLDDSRKNTRDGEEHLKFSQLDTDAFEKIIVALRHWINIIFDLVFKKESFRIEINYDAKALRMDTSYYKSTKKDA